MALSFVATNSVPAISTPSQAVKTRVLVPQRVDSAEDGHHATPLAALALAACASGVAFQSKPRARKPNRAVGVAPLRAFENEVGAIAPLGFFDPLGLSADGDIQDFVRRREAELKNGRVAMYATIGYIVPEYYRLPGFVSPSLDVRFEDIPNGIGALNVVPPEGWLQIVAYCGFLEILVNAPAHPTEPGNYYKGRFGALPGKIIKDPTKRREALNKELANGRLAMIAILAMFFQNGAAGGTGPAMWYGIPAKTAAVVADVAATASGPVQLSMPALQKTAAVVANVAATAS